MLWPGVYYALARSAGRLWVLLLVYGLERQGLIALFRSRLLAWHGGLEW